MTSYKAAINDGIGVGSLVLFFEPMCSVKSGVVVGTNGTWYRVKFRNGHGLAYKSQIMLLCNKDAK